MKYLQVHVASISNICSVKTISKVNGYNINFGKVFFFITLFSGDFS